MAMEIILTIAMRAGSSADLKIPPTEEKLEGDKTNGNTAPQTPSEEEEKEAAKGSDNSADSKPVNGSSNNTGTNPKIQSPTKNNGDKTSTKEQTTNKKDGVMTATRNGVKTTSQNGASNRSPHTGTKITPKTGLIKSTATSTSPARVNGTAKPKIVKLPSNKPAKFVCRLLISNYFFLKKKRTEELIPFFFYTCNIFPFQISVKKNVQNKQHQFAFSGTQLRIDSTSCLAKNNIQDGNSAFGSLEVTKDMKVEWTLKVMQGAQVVIGVMQTDESLKKNNTKYRKLLNNIFCTDRSGYGYFGKDGGVMKGGKYRKYGAPYKSGDSVTVLLDMVTNQLQFGKDSKPQGIAFSNIPTGCYRLAVMLPKKMHKVIIEKVQVWEIDK
ncbi:hypothetical protein RFI_27833 [Reticulomyxa filosa]|uniref:SPRY domain-containing protein n=1 Tax=Reticulomyxa filosa TaxID=46433 RepID=X6M6C3_RETFI|nr:hypothetical protein RFI_27833 [Reticulomyxa filosa]|eukprot:ETO09543.1 hypothetical protein RFI_27833 [Reticulomyxa filosa]